MMKMLLYVAAMAGLFALPQCTKDNSLSPSDPAVSNKFPMQVGDYWIYKVTNYQNDTVDTVQVSVVSRSEDSDSSTIRTILQDKWSDKEMDTQYVSLTADTVIIYYPHAMGFTTNAFIFPLKVNYPYPSVRGISSIKVLSSFKSNIELNSQINGVTVYQVEKRYLPYDYNPMREFFVILDDIAPGIGIIKEDREYITGPVGEEKISVNQTWELISVHLGNQEQ